MKRRRMIEPKTGQQVADLLVPRHANEFFTGDTTQRLVFVRLGLDEVVYPVRRVVHDMTTEPPVLVIEADPVGVSAEALRHGWRPTPYPERMG